MWTSIRLRVANFIRKNQRIIFIVILVWFIIIAINMFLKYNKPEIEPITTYNPHTAIMDTNSKVPEKLQQPISELIDTYFNYCNTKQYEQAYNMLSQDCKDTYFQTLDDFKSYINYIFGEDKIYTIQNYSNDDGVYIYQIRIMEDILKTGLTGQEDLSYYQERIVITEKDGNLELAVRDYIGKEDLNSVYEDDYIKIWLDDKQVGYETETYTIRIRNKTENIVVMQDWSEDYEVYLQVGTERRRITNDNLNIVINPAETQTYELEFIKFYDEADTASALRFDAVRILKSYTGLSITKQDELDNAVRLYSLEIPLE